MSDLAPKAPSYDDLLSLYHLSRDLFCICGLDGYFVHLNPAWHVLGYDLDELCSRPFIEFVHPADRERTLHELEERLARGDETIEFENRYVDKLGEVHWLRWNAAVDRERDLIYAVAVDVTQRREEQAQLVDSHRKSLASSRLKTQFLEGLSHDVRLVINTVIGSATLLLSGSLSDEQRRDVTEILDAASHILATFNDVLDYARLEQGRYRLGDSLINLPELVAGVLEPYQSAASERDLTLTRRLGPSVPTCVLGDPSVLSRILGNLLANALKSTHDGGVHVAVTAADKLAGVTALRFAVSDTGIGMSNEQQEALFEPFSRLDSSDVGVFGGGELTLAVVKRLVDLMKGQITVESTLGSGTLIAVRIPLRLGPVDEDRDPTPPSLTAVTTQPPLGRVLVVEDNVVNQRVAMRMLEEMGYDCDLADDGVAAIEAVRSSAYDVVLMDAQMPVMDGFAATRAIRADESAGRRLPIIAMTASATAGSRESCLSAGMDDFLEKPLRAEQLRDVIERYAVSSDSGEHEPLSPPVEQQELRRVTDGEAAFERELIQLFVDDLKRHLAVLHDALPAADSETIRLRAHSIKGASSHVGANPINRLSRQLESAAARGDLSEARTLIDRLQMELGRVEAFCASQLGTVVEPESAD